MFLAVTCEEGDKSKEALALEIMTSEQPMFKVQVPRGDVCYLGSCYQNHASLKVPIAEAESDFEMPEDEDDEDEEEDGLEEQLPQVKSCSVLPSFSEWNTSL